MLKWLRTIGWPAIIISIVALSIALFLVGSEITKRPTSCHSDHNIISEQQKDESLWQRTVSDPVALYTLLLAIFSGVLTLTTFIQIGFLIRADKTARISSEAAREAARSAKESSDFIPRVERAYVFAEKEFTSQIQWPASDEESYESTMAIRFENVGKTPAIMRELYWDVVKQPYQPTVRDMERLPGGPFPLSIVLRSGEMSKLFEKALVIELKDVPDIGAGKENLYLAGRVIYEDVFGQRHETGFCRMWRRDTGLFDAAMSERLNYYT